MFTICLTIDVSTCHVTPLALQVLIDKTGGTIAKTNEHPSPGVILLRRPSRRHHAGGTQHPLRHPTTGGQFPDCPIGGIPRRDVVSTPAVYPDAGRPGAVRLRQAVF